ncbi:MAG: TraR/DksA C4-type zinc finger protein, partial [Verrucomicrobiaceae bacterium]
VPTKAVIPPKATPVKKNAGTSKTPVPIPLPKPIRGVNVDDIPVIEMGKKPPLGAMFLKKQKQRLVDLRSHLVDTMEGVAKDSLRNRPEGSEASVGGMHMGDAGSDAYDRDFALSLLSKEQDALYEIQEALKRIDSRIYGYCEMTGHKINEERLEALPFARYTREAQEQIERDQRGGGYLRVPTRSVFNLNEDGESEDEEGEEEETTKAPASESSLDFMKE